jgi:hypothetical protein
MVQSSSHTLVPYCVSVWFLCPSGYKASEKSQPTDAEKVIKLAALPKVGPGPTQSLIMFVFALVAS